MGLYEQHAVRYKKEHAERRYRGTDGVEHVLWEVVVITVEQYEKLLCLTVREQQHEKLVELGVQPGDMLNIRFSAESREYKERWYTNLYLVGFELVARGDTPPPPTGDLPF